MSLATMKVSDSGVVRIELRLEAVDGDLRLRGETVK
jgi:hypothetical protein